MSEGRRNQCQKEKTKRKTEEHWGRVGPWKFLEEHLKAVSLLSAADGSEVKEYRDHDKAIGFCPKAVTDDLERAGVCSQGGINGEKMKA